MCGRGILDVMRFVHDEPRIGRNYRRVFPVLLRSPHGDIRHEQMVIDNYDIGLSRRTPSLKEKAAAVVWTRRFPAKVRLGNYFIPHLGARRRRQVGQRSIRRFVGPFSDRVQLCA